MERIANSQSTFSGSQDLIDDGEESDGGKEGEEEEEQEGRIPTTPALTIETLNSQVSAWTTPSSVTRTPKVIIDSRLVLIKGIDIWFTSI